MTMLNNGDPTPEQRAEVVVRRLEQFIREGRTPCYLEFERLG